MEPQREADDASMALTQKVLLKSSCLPSVEESLGSVLLILSLARFETSPVVNVSMRAVAKTAVFRMLSCCTDKKQVGQMNSINDSVTI